MSFFKSLFSAGVPGLLGMTNRRQPNPADAAQGYLAQVPALAQQHLSPYIQRGVGAEQNAQSTYGNMQSLYNTMPDLYQNMPDLYNNPNANYSDATSQYANMTNNPMEFVDEIMRGYEPSRGYNFKEKRMRDAMRGTAAAGGFAGTEVDREDQANLVREMLGQDMQQFLTNILGVQSQGASGLERMQTGRERGQERQYLGQDRAQERRYAGIQDALARQGNAYESQAGRGYDAAARFADLLSGNASERGGYAFQGQRQRNAERNQQNEQRQNFMSNLIGLGMGR